MLINLILMSLYNYVLLFLEEVEINMFVVLQFFKNVYFRFLFILNLCDFFYNIMSKGFLDHRMVFWSYKTT